MGKGESTRRTKGGGHPIVWGNGSEVPGMEVVQLANEKVDVVRGERIVLLQIVESDERESSRKVPPKNMNGGARVLRGANDVHYWGVERKGWGNVNLDNDQGIVMNFRTPLEVMKRTNEEGGSSESCV